METVGSMMVKRAYAVIGAPNVALIIFSDSNYRSVDVLSALAFRFDGQRAQCLLDREYYLIGLRCVGFRAL